MGFNLQLNSILLTSFLFSITGETLAVRKKTDIAPYRPFSKDYRDVIIDKYTARLNKNPQDLHALLELGDIFSQKGRHQDAIGYFERALVLAPDSITAMQSLAHSLHRERKYGRAEEIYQKVLKANPKDKTTLFNLGVLALDKNESPNATGTALTYFNKVLKIDAKNESALFAIAEIHKRKGKCQQAIKNYKKVLEIKNKALLAYLQIAKCYGTLKKHDDAIENYKTFITNAKSSAPQKWREQILFSENEINVLTSRKKATIK